MYRNQEEKVKASIDRLFRMESFYQDHERRYKEWRELIEKYKKMQKVKSSTTDDPLAWLIVIGVMMFIFAGYLSDNL